AQRNRAEDQSLSARHVPRGVVGYQQLDGHGTWSQDATHGSVWYPNVTVQDWAPYRHGRWTWVDPWGWTWVDDAPWGFAPFHYGRWATIGNRWAWVPGRMAPRPVYSPGVVAFMGGDGADLGIGAGPSVGWYPLAPGEAWYPTYRATPRYLGFVNFNINLGRSPRGYENHFHRRHHHAVTVVREDDFRRGRHIREHWRQVRPSGFDRARFGFVPARPDFRDRRGDRDNRFVAPRLQSPAPRVERGQFRRDQYVRPAQQWDERRPRDRDNEARDRDRGNDDRNDRGRPDAGRGDRDRRDADRNDFYGRDRRDADRNDGNGRDRRDPDRNDGSGRDRRDADRNDGNGSDRRDANRGDEARDRAVREQAQALREQQRLQADAERRAREQVRDARQQREREERAVIPARPVPRVEREERAVIPARPVQRAEREERREQRVERREERVERREERVERRPERAERAERPQRADRPDRPERAERPARAERPERAERPAGRGQRDDDGPGRGGRN
ncbi:MAG TPA: DUF6600 domain-containing protein, partial [Ramlibacter sp.]